MTGEMAFGDGHRGQAPAKRALLLAMYDITQAAAGNVPENTVLQPAGTPRNRYLLSSLPSTVRSQLERIISSRVLIAVGQKTESLEQGIGRAVETMWAHERLQTLCQSYDCDTLDQLPRDLVRAQPLPSRAVTTLDIERLALDVPGTHVRRARAWANVHPDFPCLDASGTVTLVIVPELPLGRPRPSRGLLASVQRYLDWRRIVTTQIKVVGPRYVEVRSD